MESPFGVASKRLASGPAHATHSSWSWSCVRAHTRARVWCSTWPRPWVVAVLRPVARLPHAKDTCESHSRQRHAGDRAAWWWWAAAAAAAAGCEAARWRTRQQCTLRRLGCSGYLRASRGAFCCFMCESGHRNSTSTSFCSPCWRKDVELSCLQQRNARETDSGNHFQTDTPRPRISDFVGFCDARALWIARGDARRLPSASFWTISISFAASLFSPDAGIIVCGFGWRDLNQDFQEQKRSSAALSPLEIPRKPWPFACLMSS